MYCIIVEFYGASNVGSACYDENDTDQQNLINCKIASEKGETFSQYETTIRAYQGDSDNCWIEQKQAEKPNIFDRFMDWVLGMGEQ